MFRGVGASGIARGGREVWYSYFPKDSNLKPRNVVEAIFFTGYRKPDKGLNQTAKCFTASCVIPFTA